MKTVIVPFCGYLKIAVPEALDPEQAIEHAVQTPVSVRIGSEETWVQLGEFVMFERLIHDRHSALRFAEAHLLPEQDRIAPIVQVVKEVG